MIPQNIKDIADRFLNGISTQEEEQQLARYLRQHPDTPGMEALADMMAWLDGGMQQLPPAEPQSATVGRPIGRILRWTAGIAASVALLVALAWPREKAAEEQTMVATAAKTTATTNRQTDAQPSAVRPSVPTVAAAVALEPAAVQNNVSSQPPRPTVTPEQGNMLPDASPVDLEKAERLAMQVLAFLEQQQNQREQEMVLATMERQQDHEQSYQEYGMSLSDDGPMPEEPTQAF